MFYGIRPEQQAAFNQALSSIAQMFGGNLFAADNLIALSKNLTCWLDERFIESFTTYASNEQEKSLIWRLHTLAWAGSNALRVEGDFVECGVLMGLSSAVLCKYLDFGKVSKTFYLYDTFCGLPVETSTEQERAAWNYAHYDPQQWEAFVRGRFAGYPNVQIVKGIVPHSFEAASPRKIAYLHIDMNSKQAEMLALEALFDRVSPGGMIVLDDYGWIVNREQTLAEREFMLRRGHAVLEMPTGQGLVVKH